MARIILGMLVTVHASVSSSNLIGNITHLTLFYWRQKLLSSLKQIEIPNFESIVEKTRLLWEQIISMGRVIAVPARAEDPLRQALFACLS
ncbi:hypothetical protein AXY_05390 [Amphibacillus xylanus NBRC 15112]|uniref:Uncharacterized protein n=1 Tax=Amphibacillus xylanus (strain ATCC 51415 / DSM 6626 / JCM 7361 / LMG 17667 / NBRC 15112 / Ep01) TaxID=698758 RepID=K0J2F6_AMPXN|nr:hypothetical protein AXY_05390 [Amphibacillus xylanus NBRC 15112]